MGSHGIILLGTANYTPCPCAWDGCMSGMDTEMWGDAALGCKANEYWSEWTNPAGDKMNSVAVKRASTDCRKLWSWCKSCAQGSCEELEAAPGSGCCSQSEQPTEATAESSASPPQPRARFWSWVTHQRVKKPGKGLGAGSEHAEDFGGGSRKVTTGSGHPPPPALQPAGTGCPLPAGAPQAPPRCWPAWLLAGAPKGLWGQGYPLNPSHCGVQRRSENTGESIGNSQQAHTCRRKAARRRDSGG